MRSTPMHLSVCQHAQHLPSFHRFSNCSFRLTRRAEGYQPLEMTDARPPPPFSRPADQIKVILSYPVLPSKLVLRSPSNSLINITVEEPASGLCLPLLRESRRSIAVGFLLSTVSNGSFTLDQRFSWPLSKCWRRVLFHLFVNRRHADETVHYRGTTRRERTRGRTTAGARALKGRTANKSCTTRLVHERLQLLILHSSSQSLTVARSR